MIHTTYRRGARANLRGLAWWLLALAGPFAAVGFDTWLNTEQLRMDYDFMQVSRQVKDLSESLDKLKEQQTDLENSGRMRGAAPDLGLVEPQPEQIEIIYYAGDIAALRDESPYSAPGLPGLDPVNADVPNVSFVTLIKAYVSGWLHRAPGWNKDDSPWNTDAPSSLASTLPTEAPLPSATPSGSGASLGDS